ncbi:basic proline-rich protein-like [Aquila chrysaetos chrysaetos]|uniref:basic proline-rich protein-like n=1 Tax=Aquila chrysaetos chrysaetos TaxID=223781 RepID=UPI0011772E41|nr:basic proline-rich protein-like [Aquila chrysaetos chrysaetos]
MHLHMYTGNRRLCRALCGCWGGGVNTAGGLQTRGGTGRARLTQDKPVPAEQDLPPPRFPPPPPRGGTVAVAPPFFSPPGQGLPAPRRLPSPWGRAETRQSPGGRRDGAWRGGGGGGGHGTPALSGRSRRAREPPGGRAPVLPARDPLPRADLPRSSPPGSRHPPPPASSPPRPEPPPAHAHRARFKGNRGPPLGPGLDPPPVPARASPPPPPCVERSRVGPGSAPPLPRTGEGAAGQPLPVSRGPRRPGRGMRYADGGGAPPPPGPRSRWWWWWRRPLPPLRRVVER